MSSRVHHQHKMGVEHAVLSKIIVYLNFLDLQIWALCIEP